jgi:hypothetical protein
MAKLPCSAKSYALPHLQEAKGYIVAITSGMSQLRIPTLSNYAISKMAVNRLVEFVALGAPFEHIKRRNLSACRIPRGQDILATSWDYQDDRECPRARAAHPRHPRATRGAITSSHGWQGRLVARKVRIDCHQICVRPSDVRARYISANWDIEELERDWKDKILAQRSFVAKMDMPT